MTAPDIGRPEIEKWDPDFTERVMGVIRPVVKRWFRSEVRGLELIPPGGVLLVSNHSGGLYAVDVAVFAADFYDKLGYDRPVYTLSNDLLFKGRIGSVLTRVGNIHANRDNAAMALRSGAVVVTFPGGDHDAYRPTWSANKIDFAGRTGYVTTAIETGVPIVPTVSIGAQENQLYLGRGEWLAKRLGIKRLLGVQTMPITFGFPFGLNVMIPLNLPLPTKIVTEVLKPIDIADQFGENPDVAEVDAHVRSVMQMALDRLARERRFPVVG